MASDSVGQIGLDLVVNQNQFKQQMSGILSLAKKAGLALAGAFAVKKIWDFGAACVNLGSDLNEVQNVVDVTFPRMSKQVDEFAKNAITSFGLSETMTKKFTGTFGAMAKAFGFGEKQAYDMSTALTGLSGDVASFYNISQDEAFTKLKSIFTGETVALKDLGVVMTEATLDQYALANGYGKVTAKMSETEKVALRYAFVQDKLSLASGDFIRTGSGWANQVRVLKLQFDSLKATLGQGLINVLTPVIKVINIIISKLMSLANAFKAFTEMVTGKKGGSGASAAATGMDAVAKSADKAGAATSGAGNAAKKAAKDMKGATTGIDELNIINSDTDSGGGGSGGGAGGGYSPDEFDMGKADTSAVDEMDSKYQGLIDKAKELAGLFKKGFWDSFGDTSVFDKIQASIDSIKSSLKEIFTSPEVLAAANAFTSQVTYSLGQVVGAVASIGASIADNLLGGISLFLQQNSDRIRDYIVSMFDIGSRIAEISGNFSKAIATVFSALRSDGAKKITADVIGIFSDAFMGVTKLAGTFATDVLDMITGPFIGNADLIKSTVEDTFSAIEPIFSTIKDLVSEVFTKIETAYKEHVEPMLAAFKQGFTNIGTLLLNVYNTYFLPVLGYLSDRFSEFKDRYLGPLIDKFLEFAGKVADAITKLWTGAIQPFIEWFITNVAPVISSNLKNVIDTFFGLLGAVSEVIGGILTVLGGVIDFIVGVFTGDWGQAWNGIKEIFSGIWEAIKGIVSGATEFIGNLINGTWKAISGFTSMIWNGIKTFLGGLWNGLKSLVNTIFSAIKTAIGNVWNSIKNKTSEIWDGVKSFLGGLWDGLKASVDNIFNSIKSAIGGAWDAVKNKTSEIWDGIKAFLGGLWDKVKEKASTAFNGVKDTVVGVWDTIKTKTKEIWDGIWSTIKGVINSIIGGVESMVNRVIDGINAIINALNKVADKVPGVSDHLIPTIPSLHLPKLAQGGFVRANTPQLAVIGDNRHHGEIVAPEDKMKSMVDRAVALASQSSSGMSDQYLSIMVDLLQRIIDLIGRMDLTVNIDIREIKKKLVELDKRSGYALHTT